MAFCSRCQIHTAMFSGDNVRGKGSRSGATTSQQGLARLRPSNSVSPLADQMPPTKQSVSVALEDPGNIWSTEGHPFSDPETLKEVRKRAKFPVYVEGTHSMVRL